MSSIKKNFLYSSILTTANYVFPLLTFPYITRVLGVANVGICEFIDSIINYYTIFATLGLSTVAVREIACNKTDKLKMSKAFSSLLIFNIITTMIVIAILICSIYVIPEFYDNRRLMYIGVFKLLFKAFLIEWLYTGIEDFKYVTLRSLLVRCFYVIAVFLFVQKEDDYIIYYALTTFTIVINAIINIFYSRKYVTFSFIGIRLKPYLKSIITLGVYSILTSMYTTFNISYLGFVGGKEQVGYYTTATKLHSIILALFTAFTGVMMPRMVSLISNGDRAQFKIYIRKSIGLLIAFALPVIIFSIIYSDYIVRLIAGAGYEAAVPCMQIVMPLVLVIGYEQILVLQILTPLGRDSDILINSIVGAVIGIVANIILVPLFNSIGSAVVWCISEIAVLLMAQLFVDKQIGSIFPCKLFIKYILLYVPLVIFLIFLHKFNPLGGLGEFFIGCVITVFYFLLIEIYFIKNDIVLNMLQLARSKILGIIGGK